MKKKIEYTIFKALLLVAVLFCTSLVASAQSKLTVDAQKFVNHDVVNVPINFSKANPVVAMNFNIKLPDFLEFTGNPIRNDDRFFSSQTTISFNKKNGNVVIASFGTQHEIEGEEGLLLSIPVKVKDSVTVPSTGNIRISNITFSGAGDGSLTGVAPSWNQESFNVKAEYLPYEIAFKTDLTKLTANAGTTVSLPVNISNNCDIYGFQAQITAPAGIKWNEVGVLSNRCPNDGMMSVTQVPNREGVYNIVYISMSNTPLSGNDGLVFTLDANVAQDFALQSGDIKVDNVQVSYTPGAAVPATGFTLPFVNGTTAYSNLVNLVDGLRTQLTNALNEIAQDCPDVKDNFTGEAISQAIEALSGEIETLYANGGLNDAENRLTETAGNIGNDIRKLVEDAKNAQRNHANNGAYNAVIDQINALQELLNTTSTTVAEKYPGIDVEAEKQAAQNAINKAKADAKAALDAVAAEGQFNYTVPTEEITNLINAIPTAAETKRVAANTEAYNNVLAQIEVLQQKLNETAASVAQTYPGIDVEAEKTAAQNAINKAKADAKAALDAVAAEGQFNYTVPTDEITNLINAITTAAETKRVAANTEAYNKVNAEIAELQKKLNDVVTTVATNYPGINIDAEKQAAQNAINKAKADAEAALQSVAASGFFSYTVPTEEITNLINAIATAAETKRVATNTEAYNKVNAEIAELQKKLNDVVTTVATNYPGINVDAEKTAAQQAIDKAKTDAEAALTAVAASGFYSYKVPAENINALITAILTAADGKRVAANEQAYNESLALIEQLQQKLYAENARMASEYPGINVGAEKQAAQEAINTAKKAAEAAYKAVTLAGFYSYQVPVEDITALINAIGKAAETKRQNGNKEAYDSAVASLAELQKKLDDTSATVATNYPGIDVNAEKTAAQDAINNAKAAAEAAKKAAEEKGSFSYEVPVAEITALIDAIKTTAEAKRVAANKTAYEAAIATIAALQKKLDDMEKTLLKDYPGIDMDSEIEAAGKAISDAKAAADAALAAVAQAGFFSYTVPTEDIEKLINALPVTANEKRMEANEKAYNETLAIIADLQAELNDMKAEVAQKYPDADAKIVADAVKKAQDAIDAESAAAKKAYDNVAEKGNYSYEVNEDAIKLLIADIMTQAGTAGIYSICIDELPSDIKIFDLNGYQLKQPKLGEVNIIVHKNGQVSKVIVK